MCLCRLFPKSVVFRHVGAWGVSSEVFLVKLCTPISDMMKSLLLAISFGASSAFLLSGCGKNSQAVAPDADTTEIPLAVEQGPGHDDERHFEKTAAFDGKTYRIKLSFRPDETLSLTKDRFGDPYMDNRVDMQIACGDSVLYQRSFTKADFSALLDKEDVRSLILGGIAFSGVESSGFQFGAQLNAPGDEEGGLAFKLTVPLCGQGEPRIVRDANQGTSSSAAMD